MTQGEKYEVTSNSEIMCWIAFVVAFLGGLVSVGAIASGTPGGLPALAGFLASGMLCVISSQVHEFHKRYEQRCDDSKLPNPVPVVATKSPAKPSAAAPARAKATAQA